MLNKILILYPDRNDPQSMILYEELIKQGLEVLYLPFRNDDEHSHSKDFFINKKEIYYQGQNIGDIEAVYIRALSFSIPADLPPYLSKSEYALWRAKFIGENVKFSTMFSLLNILRNRGVLVINHPDTYYLHNTKSQFFSYLYHHGFSVPETSSTNDYQTAKEFCKRFECVSKSAYGVGATRKIKENYLNADCGLLQTPAIFQENIKGNTIRVHTVGDKVVLSLKIISDGVDSRSDTTGFEVYQLPKKAEQEIIQINKEFKIFYSAWDIIINMNGNYYLLDCNPGPYIFWIGNYFTRFVLEVLAQYIKLYSQHKSSSKATSKLILPKLDFNKLYVNNTDYKFDYSTQFVDKLRIRF